MCCAPFTARVIDRATRLRAIVKHGVGIDAIDIAATRALGIPVVNVPRYAEETVAGGAYIFMISMARRMKALQRAMREQGWVRPEPAWLGHDMAGKTLGLIGLGQIVDEAALLLALLVGRIAGAALDVYGQEPSCCESHPLSPLYAMDNVLLWPHLTLYTHKAMRRLEDETLARCFEALEGRALSVHSNDPRLRAQRTGVRFVDDPSASPRCIKLPFVDNPQVCL